MCVIFSPSETDNQQNRADNIRLDNISKREAARIFPSLHVPQIFDCEKAFIQ